MHEKPAVIKAAFEANYKDGEGLSPSERLNKRNEVARHLVATTYKDIVPELERRAKEAHEQDLKTWGLDLDGIGEAQDIDMLVSPGIRQSPPTNTLL